MPEQIAIGQETGERDSRCVLLQTGVNVVLFAAHQRAVSTVAQAVDFMVTADNETGRVVEETVKVLRVQRKWIRAHTVASSKMCFNMVRLLSNRKMA